METRQERWIGDSERDLGAADLLSSRAAASMLGVSQGTIRRAIARGEISAVKRGGVYRIARADPRRYHIRERVIALPAATRPRPAAAAPVSPA